MKKTVLISLLFIFAFFAAFGQNSSIDLVLVLDTSRGMSSSYGNVSDYITGGFLSEFLRVGDTFHLISFSQNQKLDIARRITSVGDVETIIGRMLLQYPVEPGYNVENALAFTENYIITLPARPKKIVLVSAGASSDISGLVNASRQRIGSGNTIDYVQVTPGQPLSNLPRSGRTAQAVTPAAAQITPTVTQTTTPAATQTTTPAAAQTTAPAQTTTSTTTSTTPATTSSAAQTTTSQTQTTTPAATQTTPAQTTPSQTQTTTPAATQTTTPAAAQTTAPAQTTTSTTPATTQTTPAQTTPSQTQTTTPAAQTSTPARTSTSASSPAQTSRSGMAWYSSLPFIIALIILALLILGLIIFFLSKKIGKSGSSTVSAQAKAAPAPKEKAVDHSKDLASYKSSQNRRTTPYDALDKSKPVEISSTGPLLLNLFVEDQNTNIGKRNIHNLKSGYKLSVGGGKNDDFYIFLVPMPANIGEIRRNGSQLTFTPHKPKYFPEIGSNEVKDCINKTINIVSDKNYDMRFRFEMYEDPLVELNRILNSLNVPG